MKKIILFTAALFVILFTGCRKEDNPEKALSGEHPVTIKYYGYSPSGNTGTQGFSNTGEGTMKIKQAGNGIYVTVVQSAQVIVDIMLDYKSDPADGSVRYSPSAYTAGQMPPYLEYTPSDGKFHYYKVNITGHRSSETYDISGQL